MGAAVAQGLGVDGRARYGPSSGVTPAALPEPPRPNRFQSVKSEPTLRSPPTFVAAAISVAWIAVVLDAIHRTSWAGVSRLRHYAAAFLLYTLAGTVAGGAAALGLAAERAAKRRVVARMPSAARWFTFAAGALVAVAATASTAFWTFSGERVRTTLAGKIGPWLLLAVFAAAGALSTVAVRAIASRIATGRTAFLLPLAAVLLALGFGASRVDLTLYVSVYARLHTALEALSAALATAGLVLIAVRSAPSHPAIVRGVNAVAAAGAVVTVLMVSVEPLRDWVTDSLRHAWREPVYVGRMLSRFQIAEGFIRDPKGWRGATMSNVVRLRERYDIATTARSPLWDKPIDEPAALRDRLLELRGRKERNIVVFYVDTLRADIARDPRVMPNFNRFAKEAVDFRRAYTTGSDTLHALPGILGGSYDLFAPPRNDVLHVARAAGYDSVLFVAQSAHEFLSKMLPEFKFERVQEVPDYAAGNENVWGYGADQPTAARIVDRTLDWLRQRDDEHYLLWLFNFDLHNWRELDEAYVRAAGKEYKLLDEADPIWRYRAVARSIDAQFQRLLDGLRDAGVADDTVVLFISDHGEGLGQNGFWVHSVFLWEGLIRVPLTLRVPGVAPAAVTDVVSLVDVAPTLARFMAPEADRAGYQGEDLMEYLVPNHPKRALPLILMSTLKEVPVRLGIIDPGAPWKLVLSLEGAVPELYDLRAQDPDARDVSAEHRPEMLGLLNQLVRAPLFPRPGEAGDGSLDLAAKEGREAVEIERGAQTGQTAADPDDEENAKSAAPAAPSVEDPPK